MLDRIVAVVADLDQLYTLTGPCSLDCGSDRIGDGEHIPAVDGAGPDAVARCLLREAADPCLTAQRRLVRSGLDDHHHGGPPGRREYDSLVPCTGRGRAIGVEDDADTILSTHPEAERETSDHLHQKTERHHGREDTAVEIHVMQVEFRPT